MTPEELDELERLARSPGSTTLKEYLMSITPDAVLWLIAQAREAREAERLRKSLLAAPKIKPKEVGQALDELADCLEFGHLLLATNQAEFFRQVRGLIQMRTSGKPMPSDMDWTLEPDEREP